MTVVDGRSQYGRRSGRAPFQNTIGGFYGSYANFKPGGTLPSYYSVTRASVDYAWNGTQFVQVASGAPSFWYGKGLAVFGAATNLALWSSDLTNGVYTVVGASAATVASAIAGGTARRLTATVATDYFYQTIGTFTGGAETAYLLIEKGTASATDIDIYNNTTPAVVARARYTWASDTASLVSGSGTVVGVPVSGVGPNGGKLAIIGLTATSTAGNIRIIRGFVDPLGSTGTSVFHHMQLVTGTRILPPIVTNAATASRAADVISIAIANLPWLSASPAQLYLGAQVELLQVPDSIVSAFDLNDGTASNSFDLYINASNATCNTIAGGVTSAAISAVSSSGITKAAMSSTANNFLAAFNGVAGTADVSGSMPTGLSTLNIGHARSGFQLQGFIGSIYAGPTTQSQSWLNGRTSSSSY